MVIPAQRQIEFSAILKSVGTIERKPNISKVKIIVKTIEEHPQTFEIDCINNMVKHAVLLREGNSIYCKAVVKGVDKQGRNYKNIEAIYLQPIG